MPGPIDFKNRTLNKYGYPPDKQQKAIDTVMKQAEVLADYWVDK
jgi:type I restriction enzyme R subunit